MAVGGVVNGDLSFTLPAEVLETIARRAAELVLEQTESDRSGSPYLTVTEAAELLRAKPDKGVQIRMGQAHVKGWIPSPCRSSATTPIRSERKTWRPTSSAREEPYVYENLPEKEDSAIKILLTP